MSQPAVFCGVKIGLFAGGSAQFVQENATPCSEEFYPGRCKLYSAQRNDLLKFWLVDHPANQKDPKILASLTDKTCQKILRQILAQGYSSSCGINGVQFCIGTSGAGQFHLNIRTNNAAEYTKLEPEDGALYYFCLCYLFWDTYGSGAPKLLAEEDSALEVPPLAEPTQVSGTVYVCQQCGHPRVVEDATVLDCEKCGWHKLIRLTREEAAYLITHYRRRLRKSICPTTTILIKQP